MPTITSLRPDISLLKKLSPKIAARWRVIPLKQENGHVTVATSKPENHEALDNLKTLFGAPIIAVTASDSDIDKALKEHFGLGAVALGELTEPPKIENGLVAEIEVSDTAMVRFVNDLVAQAIAERATDIHIEPHDEELFIRFRVDGILYPVKVPENLVKFRAFLISRIKVMAQMNIAEKRLPQDGRIRFQLNGDELDIRVSIIPTIYGESIDMRLLPRTRMVLGLEELGMIPADQEKMARLIRRPNGIILVTGPTGHGKTTTLYACLSQINTPDKKIITIEDPVEYRLRGVNQIQAHTKIGLTFASGLRSILRQDPDVIMVGEIRDPDTAEVAIRASLTGHLVFSTLHTNDAIGAIVRLVDMGIEPYLVASSINAVLAQRLVRLICKVCNSPASLLAGGLKGACENCRGSGYSGRTGIFEFLLVTEPIREMILSRASVSDIRKKATAAGMRTLFQEGKLKADSGFTTMDEVMRVTEEV